MQSTQKSHGPCCLHWCGAHRGPSHPDAHSPSSPWRPGQSALGVNLLFLCWVPQLPIFCLPLDFISFFLVGIFSGIRPFLFILFCSLLCYGYMLCCLKVLFVTGEWQGGPHARPTGMSWGSFMGWWVCSFHETTIYLHKLRCESPVKLDELLLPLWSCVLRAWLHFRKSVFFSFPPARGHRLSGLHLEVASHHKHYILVDIHHLPWGHCHLNPLY